MMPTLVRATVVVWEVQTVAEIQVVGDAPVVRNTRVVSYKKSDPVSIFTDGGALDSSAIISQYILKLSDGSPRPDNEQLQLLQASGMGLLQVYDIKPTALMKPELPSPSLDANPPAPPAPQAKSTAGQHR